MIKAEPFLPDEDYDNPARVTDFYEFSRANCLFLNPVFLGMSSRKFLG